MRTLSIQFPSLRFMRLSSSHKSGNTIMCKAERQDEPLIPVSDNEMLVGLYEKIQAAVADIALSAQLKALSTSAESKGEGSDSSCSGASSDVGRCLTSQKKKRPPECQDHHGSNKRRRRPSDSSTTERGFQRISLEHQYHDFSRCTPMSEEVLALDDDPIHTRCNGGVSSTFPVLLHQLLDEAQDCGFSDIVSWLPHGRAFLVKDPDRFVDQVMPRYFRQTRFRSFQRQLSLYGFLRLTRKGSDCGSYYHELCLRGMPFLCQKIQRQRVKGWMVRQAASPETEPSFWDMPTVGIPDPTPIAEPNIASTSGFPAITTLVESISPDARAVLSLENCLDKSTPRESTTSATITRPATSPISDTARLKVPSLEIGRLFHGKSSFDDCFVPAADYGRKTVASRSESSAIDFAFDDHIDLISFLLDVDLDSDLEDIQVYNQDDDEDCFDDACMNQRVKCSFDLS